LPRRHEVQRRANRSLARLRHFDRYSFQFLRQRDGPCGRRPRRQILPEDGDHHARRDLRRIVRAVQHASRVEHWPVSGGRRFRLGHGERRHLAERGPLAGAERTVQKALSVVALVHGGKIIRKATLSDFQVAVQVVDGSASLRKG